MITADVDLDRALVLSFPILHMRTFSSAAATQ
jgi:hypothetical protein